MCLQSRETFSLSENVAEFIPHVLPWMPLWTAVRDALNLHTRSVYLAVCASWGYWHEEHVTNNGVSSLSPATTGCNGHVLWFLGILNNLAPSPLNTELPSWIADHCGDLYTFTVFLLHPQKNL